MACLLSVVRRSGTLFLVLIWIYASAWEAEAGTATLSWQPVTEDTSGHAEVLPVYYSIYCDTVPAFVPDSANFLATTLMTSYVHTDPRLDDPNQNLFYQVRAADTWGNYSAPSGTVGEVAVCACKSEGIPARYPDDAAGDTMKTVLLTQGLLSLSSPYHDAPRAVTQLPSDAVDWVLLQLRNPETATIVSQESFLLNKDGFLTELDGVRQQLGMTGCPPGAYQLILRHRNHVSVMSRSTSSFSEAAAGTARF